MREFSAFIKIEEFMLLFSAGFFNELRENRTCYIGGRKSTGKTLLGLEIAEKFLKEGYKFVSNMSCVWNEDYFDENFGLDNDVFGIVDEGGIYTRTYKTVSGFTEFSRKTRSIILFVGRKAPHDDLCDFAVHPLLDMWKHLMIPINIWGWEVYQKRKNYRGIILQTGWQAYYGLYSSIDPGDYPLNLLAFFEKRAQSLFDKYGRMYNISDVAQGVNYKGQSNTIESNRDMATMAQKIRDNLSIHKRKSTGRFRR
ncbi:hypothetical protein K8R33_04210 [archaeon]|nr:hypothetical protein [archaeon]